MSRTTDTIGMRPGSQSLKRGAGGEYIGVAVTPSNDLHSNGQVTNHASGDRRGWMAGKVDGIG